MAHLDSHNETSELFINASNHTVPLVLTIYLGSELVNKILVHQAKMKGHR